MKHAKPVTVAALAAMLVATAATTAACSSNGGTTQAGQAATVGSTTITNSDLNDWVSGVLETLGQPKDTANPNTTTGSLNVMIYLDLLDDLAAKAGVVVTPGQVDAAKRKLMTAGATQHDLEVSAAQSNVPPAQLDNLIKANLIVADLENLVAPGQPQQAQAAAFNQAVLAEAAKVGVTVSPRYGTWQATTIKLGAPPNDLSVPAPQSS